MVDNLREFLSQYDPEVPHYFGKPHFTPYRSVAIGINQYIDTPHVSACIVRTQPPCVLTRHSLHFFSLLRILFASKSMWIPIRPGCKGKRFLLHRGSPKLEHSYYSGGSGYVLSRAALRMLVRF